MIWGKSVLNVLSSSSKNTINYLWNSTSMKGGMLCTFLIIFSFLNQGGAQTRLAEVPRIDATMAFYKYKAGNAILIDAMPVVDFKRQHILGSINLPNDGPQDIERIQNMELPFPKYKEIIVYCS